MCTKTIKLIFMLLPVLLASNAIALDTSEEEKACTDIGFKKKTEAHANCVLELLSRKKKPALSTAAQPSIPLQQNVEPPIKSADDATCRGHGFKYGATEHSDCLLKLDIARREAQQRNAAFEEQKRQYNEQKRRQNLDDLVKFTEDYTKKMTPAPTEPMVPPPSGFVPRIRGRGDE